MIDLDYGAGIRVPRAAPDPTAATHALTADRFCVTWLLPASPDRQSVAQQLVKELVPLWGVPPFHAERWLVPAAALLASSTDFELSLQIDRPSQLLTLELWSNAQVVFGVDDWIG